MSSSTKQFLSSGSALRASVLLFRNTKDVKEQRIYFELQLRRKASIPARASVRENRKNFGWVIGNAERSSLGPGQADGQREKIF